jgi:hypothetical protein
MKTFTLMPHRCRILGISVLIFGIICIFGINIYTPTSNNDIRDMAKMINTYDRCFPAVFLGLLMIGFSKEKIEDEHIAKLRLESLQWAIVANYSILFYCFFFVSGTSVVSIVMLNLLTPIVFFIVRFRWKIWQLNKLSKAEEELA